MDGVSWPIDQCYLMSLNIAVLCVHLHTRDPRHTLILSHPYNVVCNLSTAHLSTQLL